MSSRFRNRSGDKQAQRRRRRAQAAAGVAAAAALVLAACSSTSSTSSSSSSSSSGKGTTITVGVINNFGIPNLGTSATNTLQGFNIGIQYVYAHGGVLGGAKYKLVTGDEGATPATAVSEARTLLGQGINLFSGPAITPDTEAAGPILDSAGALYFTDATTTSVTGASRAYKNVYRLGTNDAMNAKGLSYVVGAKYKSATEVDVFGYDYQEGKDSWTAIQGYLKNEGLSFTSPQQVFVPLTATDYRSQIGAMSSAVTAGGTKLLALLTYGAGDLNFLQQAQTLGLTSKYAAILTTDEYYLEAVALNGKAPDVWNAYDVCDWQLYNNPQMSYLETEYHAQTGQYPSDWVAQGFDQALELSAAINKAKSDNPAKVMTALDGLTTNLAVGPVTMNGSTHQAESPTSVCETVGDPSAPGGVKLVTGQAVPYSIAGQGS
jgi:branched-chain amino acid transport system substrate-binding protein